ncbi:cyclic nucleotide-binding domain-containing protein [Desulfovibrio ferrophilus]|uniref:Putative transcriptional regulator, Crp/Fnr family n=1 Tax=Desulfovibrio ferrophilus TaxID=241368 RepID=A0A2Z6B0Q9_9BACT|nr:cyclic nucleotide-binding domain-containing protein [Desulfovibrio ferrophilus]BBD09045.1 putative transcriptional regulator, Crp/Fnr family [Desulfovibrio ferrophilus]
MQESAYLEGHEEYLANLRRMPLFHSMEDDQLRAVLSLSKLRKYDKGETIINEGAFDSWMYFIISGRVRVEKAGRKIGEICGSGSVFGEMGVLSEQERSATVRAHTDAMCLAVDASFLERLDEKDRNACYTVLYRMFVDILAERLRETTTELATAKEKMAVLRKKIVDGE